MNVSLALITLEGHRRSRQYHIQAERVKTRCSAATSVLRMTKDYERYRVTPRIALIDRVGALSGATRSVQPARSASQRDEIRHRWSGFSSRRGLHRRHQFVKYDKVEHPPEIVCERGQAEFTSHLLQSAHQEGALVHPLLDRAKRMFHRLTPLIENLGPLCQPFLHPVQHGLIFQP